jgi:SAM-dependent methyltransferase
VRAVGLEIVPEIAEEAKCRAKTAGLDKRVEVRCLDARALAERDAFDAAYGAQEFFDEAARAEVLAAILRALRPGGLLMLQELSPTRQRPGRYRSARAWTASFTVASAPAMAPLRRRSWQKRRLRDSPTSKPPRPRWGGSFSCADLDELPAIDARRALGTEIISAAPDRALPETHLRLGEFSNRSSARVHFAVFSSAHT